MAAIQTDYKPIHELTQGTGMLCYQWDNGWQHPVAARALCEDGKIRTVRLNQDADTFFSWPGRVTIGKRTIKVYVSANAEGVLCAHPDPKRTR